MTRPPPAAAPAGPQSRVGVLAGRQSPVGAPAGPPSLVGALAEPPVVDVVELASPVVSVPWRWSERRVTGSARVGAQAGPLVARSVVAGTWAA